MALYIIYIFYISIVENLANTEKFRKENKNYNLSI